MVCGHWSTLGLTITQGVHAIDTGAVWGGKLTALQLDSEELRVVQVPGRDVPRPEAAVAERPPRRPRPEAASPPAGGATTTGNNGPRGRGNRQRGNNRQRGPRTGEGNKPQGSGNSNGGNGGTGNPAPPAASS